jgi:excisionase family DNA binding protein
MLTIKSKGYIEMQSITNCYTSKLTMQENLLTVDQVARYLRVDKFTIYRLVTQRKIPAFRVGNQWRFKRAMIDSWLIENANFSKGKPRK